METREIDLNQVDLEYTIRLIPQNTRIGLRRTVTTEHLITMFGRQSVINVLSTYLKGDDPYNLIWFPSGTRVLFVKKQ